MWLDPKTHGGPAQSVDRHTAFLSNLKHQAGTGLNHQGLPAPVPGEGLPHVELPPRAQWSYLPPVLLVSVPEDPPQTFVSLHDPANFVRENRRKQAENGQNRLFSPKFAASPPKYTGILPICLQILQEFCPNGLSWFPQKPIFFRFLQEPKEDTTPARAMQVASRLLSWQNTVGFVPNVNVCKGQVVDKPHNEGSQWGGAEEKTK
jgi:hypothetical protein